jgi:hypothetical protein
MWTSLRRRMRHGIKGGRDAVVAGCTVAFLAIAIILFLVRSFTQLPVNLQLSQQCRMSRMWPSYIPYKIQSPSGLDAKYQLFLYREAYPGRGKSEDEPRGTPALFIPGNAGSFGQIRSVASSAHQWSRWNRCCRGRLVDG